MVSPEWQGIHLRGAVFTLVDSCYTRPITPIPSSFYRRTRAGSNLPPSRRQVSQAPFGREQLGDHWLEAAPTKDRLSLGRVFHPMQLLPKGVDIVPGLVAGLPGSGRHNVPGLLAGLGREHQPGDCAGRRPCHYCGYQFVLVSHFLSPHYFFSLDADRMSRSWHPQRLPNFRPVAGPESTRRPPRPDSPRP